MHTLQLSAASNIKAIAASLTFHAVVAIWLFSSVTRIEIAPQHMIKVALVAAPSAEPVEQKSLPLLKPEPTKHVQNYKVKKPRESSRAMQRVASPPSAQATPTKLSETPISTEGKTSSTSEAAQLAMTKPLFDAAYLNNPPPEYPAHARRRNIEGTVMLDVAVSTEGAARTVLIARSSGFAMLDESAKRAVLRWKFVPAKRGDEIVEARVIVPVEYRLE